MPDVHVWSARPHRLLQPVLREIGALYQSGKACVLLVPEQFTLQAEREILTRLQLPGLFSIEVVSPTKLRQRVTEAAGTDERMPLTAAGQQMAVGYALETCADRLRFYQASVSRRGFAQKLTALIADMKRGGLEPDTLSEYAKTLPEGIRSEKLKDIALLYGAYQNTLKDRLGDGDDQNQYVTQRIAESGLMQGKFVFTYGFDAMTEPMIVLLCAIARECERLTVGLVSDGPGAADQELYLPVRQSVARFRSALEDRGIALRETQLPPEPLAHAPAIAHLDNMLFAHPQKKYTGEQDDVYLSQFHSPFEEATAAARQILRLAAQGVPLDRIAVLYPDQNGYPFAVSAAFQNSGLPFYTDEKLPALSHGLVQFLLASLRAMADGFLNDDVFALMKSGYAPIGFDDACTLENYAREYGINYGRWLQPFRKGEEAECARCEVLRKTLIMPLVRAREAIVAARTAVDSMQAVMGLLTDVNAYDTLQKEEEALLREGLLVRAGQNSQIWQTVLDLFDPLLILSDGKRLPLSHIAERFESGFSAISLAALPPAANMLHVGVLGHSLSGEMEIVFLLGLNDGMLSKASDSLLTEEERALAQEQTQTFLGMTEESRLLFARLDVKRAMTLPTKRLYLSYARTDPAGTPLQPLDLAIDLQERLFEYLPEVSDSEEALPISAQQAMVTLGDLLREYASGEDANLPAVWKRRLSALLGAPATSLQTVQLLHAVGFHMETLPLVPDTARRLFGDRTLSVSRLEEFAACPFRHYVAYGLKPEERKDWEVTPIETGNFFHDSLQRFAQIACQNPQFPNIPQEEILQMTQAASAPLINALRLGPMGDGPRSLAALAQAQRVLHRACATVTSHLAAGSFRLDREEAKFGYPGEDSFPPVALRLTDGTEITLHGRIDRIDRLETADGVYRRVVDYKSGSYAALDAAELWHGMQLQLMLYLDAVTRNTGEAKPAGAFYFHLFDPMSKADGSRPEAVQADIQKQLQMNGIALADPSVLHAMDGSGENVAIPSASTQSGAIRKNARVLDETHLDALMNHSKGMAAQFSARMLAGDITVQPVKHGMRESCDYCEYRSICGYDPLAGGAQGREIYSMTLDELAQQLDREANAGSGSNT